MKHPDPIELILRAFEQCPTAGDRVITLRYNGYIHEAARKAKKERERERNQANIL